MSPEEANTVQVTVSETKLPPPCQQVLWPMHGVPDGPGSDFLLVFGAVWRSPPALQKPSSAQRDPAQPGVTDRGHHAVVCACHCCDLCSAAETPD